MHRELLGMVQRFQPIDGDYQTKARFLDFITSNNDCFDASGKQAHITGSAWIVNNRGSHVLATLHRKLNKWIQPGGHAEAGEVEILRVSHREAQEESGLEQIHPVSLEIFDLGIYPIPAREKTEAHEHYDITFAFRVWGSEEYKISKESLDLRWVEIDRLEETCTEESMRRMKRNWQQNYQLQINKLPQMSGIKRWDHVVM